MPLAPPTTLGDSTPDLAAQAPVAQPRMPAIPQDQSGGYQMQGTGANDPQYSTLDKWAAAARQTVLGKASDEYLTFGRNPADQPAYRSYGLSMTDVMFGAKHAPNEPDAPIPQEMLPLADKYVGLHTREEIAYRTYQLKQELSDLQILKSSKWGGLATMALGVSDPLTIASMFVPIAGETRIANAVRAALVGGGVSAADEMVMHEMDPLHEYGAGSLLNIGAGTLLSGLLGAAIRPHVQPRTMEQMRAELQAALDQASPSRVTPAEVAGAAPVETADMVARDLRAAVEQHSEALKIQSETAQQAAAHLEPAEVQGRITASEEALRALDEAAGGVESPEAAPLREQAQAELDAAQRDWGTLENAAAAREADRAFHVEHNPEAEISQEGAQGEAGDGYHVSEQELTDAVAQQFEGLRSRVPGTEATGAAGEGKPAGPVPAGQAGGGTPAGGAAGLESGGTGPHPVYRGGRGGALTEEHFQQETFGKATERPSAGLGVWFTNQKNEAAQYGKVTQHFLDMKNPLELKVEDLPAFNSVQEATAWREQQRAAGYDGLVLDSSHLGGPTHYIPFDFTQVLRPATPSPGSRAATALVQKSSAPQVAGRVLEQLQQLGRFDPKTNAAYAMMVGDFYGTQASRLGLTADELFARYPLHVAGTERPAAFGQGLNAPFYSGAVRAVEDMMQASASGKQWSATLENLRGVTREELDWMGVREWLGDKAKVSRQELLDYMRANELRVTEAVKSEADTAQYQQLRAVAADANEVMQAKWRTVEQAVPPMAGVDRANVPWWGEELLDPVQRDNTLEKLWRIGLKDDQIALLEDYGRARVAFRDAEQTAENARLGSRATATRYERYTLPGGENYRELLMTLPSEKVAAQQRQLDNMIEAAGEEADPARRAEMADEWMVQKRIGEAYHSAHWNEPNVLAHARVNERLDAAGHRVLHIEEVQSDWHQTGRDKGYITQADRTRLAQVEDQMAEMSKRRLTDNRMSDEPGWFRLADEKDALRAKMGAAVPDAPLKRSWPEVVMKRLVRYAAENGIDRITWTTGKQQTARYNLSRHVDELLYKRNADGTFEVSAMTGGRGTPLGKALTRNEVADQIGQELAAKMERGEGTPPPADQSTSQRSHGYTSIAGEGLRVGGDGMRGFYDTILPRVASKLAKKYGAKVSKLKLAKTEGAGLPNKSEIMDVLKKYQRGDLTHEEVNEELGVEVDGQRLAEIDDIDPYLGDRGLSERRLMAEEIQQEFGGQSAATVHTMDIPPAMRDAALAGQPLFQANRGSYSPQGNILSLLPAADRSTFIHEAGHHFLDVLGQIAGQADAPLSIRQDMGTLLDWFGFKGGNIEAWRGLTLDQQRIHHEQFARAFEAYVREGTAPSTRLAAVFDKFRQWLVQIYKAFNSTAAKLTPDVRKVMDRMLATENEIEVARAARMEAAEGELARRVAGDQTLRDQLRDMSVHETGWAQVGGRTTISPDDLGGGTFAENERMQALNRRTSWIPNAEWWPGRPGEYSPEEVRGIVDKALAGEPLGPKQQLLVEYMSEVADERVATEPYLPSTEELQAGGFTQDSKDAYEAGMVARARMIDENAVDGLAHQYVEDSTGFMRRIKELLDAHDQDAAIARNLAPDPEPLGDTPHGPAAAGPAGAETGARPASPSPTLQSERAATDAGTVKVGAARMGGPAAQELGRRQAPPPNIADLLARLPPDVRAQFQQRIMNAMHPDGGLPPRVPRGPIEPPAEPAPGGPAGMPELTLQDVQLARGGRTLGKALSWFAPGPRVLHSPSLAARKGVVAMFETHEMLEMNVPSRAHPLGVPTPASVETMLKRWEGRWAEGFKARDKLYRAYRARELGPTEGQRLGKRAWNEEVSFAMRRGDQHAIPEVAEAARLTRALVFDPLKKLAQATVDPEGRTMLPTQGDLLRGTAESYLMRQYDRAKIRADRLGWDALLREGFEKQGMTPGEAATLSYQVTRNLLGAEMGMLDYDSVAFRGTVPNSGRLQERKILLPDALLEKYLANDIDHLSHAYLKSLAPQVEVTRRFGDKDLQGLFAQITDEYHVLTTKALVEGDQVRANALTERMRADLRDMGAMRDRLYGIFGTPADPTGWFQRSGRILRSVNALRLLGSAALSEMADLGTVVLKHGLGNTMASSMKLASSIEAIRMNRGELNRMGAALDMIMNTTAMQMGDFGAHSDYAVQAALNRASRAFTMITLETPLITTMKSLAGAMAQDEILKAAERAVTGKVLSKMDRLRANQSGLGNGVLERIGREYRQHGRQVRSLRFGMSDKWADQAAAKLYEAAVAKASEGAALSPSKGDTPLWTSYEMGRAIFQFKTFGAVAVRRLMIPLAQGLAHADLRAAAGLATMVTMGSIVYLSKQTASGQPIEKNPERFALEVLNQSNLLGWTAEFFYPALWAMGSNNFSRWGDRQTWETLGGPVLGEAVDAWDLRLPAKVRGMFGAYDPADAHFTRSDIHRLRRMMPGQNLWYLRRAVNALEGKIGDAAGLPPDARSVQ